MPTMIVVFMAGTENPGTGNRARYPQKDLIFSVKHPSIC